MGRKNGRLSTDGGQSIGQNVFGDFGAAGQASKADDPAPAVVKKKKDAGLRREKSGRAGKWVTVVHGIDRPFPRTEADKYLGRFKKQMGAGGKLTKEGFEIQGDHAEVITSALEADGYRVKRTGA